MVHHLRPHADLAALPAPPGTAYRSPPASYFTGSHPPYESTRRLTAEQVRYHRRVLDLHATDPTTGTCHICHVPRCPDWRGAFDNLAVAGEVMAEPDRWDGTTGHRRSGG